MKLIPALLVFVVSSVTYATQMAIIIERLPFCSYKETEKLIEHFKKYKVPEVYGFIDGADIDFDNLSKVGDKQHKRSEDAVRLWVDSGHALGNQGHATPYGNGWHLASLFFSPKDKVKAQIKKNEPYMEKYAGKKNWKYFRGYDFHVIENTEKEYMQLEFKNLFSELGYKYVPVTINGSIKFDSEWDFKPDAKSFVDMLTLKLQDMKKLSQTFFGRSGTQIVSLRCQAEGEIISDEILSAFQKEGVEFVTLEKALQDEMYKFDVMGIDFFSEVILRKDPKANANQLKNEFYCRYNFEKLCIEPRK